jgi:hypothetical protein
VAITPVTPVDLEKLVTSNTSIIVDLTLAPTEAVVDGVTVFDGALFLASWTGSLINLTGGGKRLVLTPPAAFALAQLVSVTIRETGGAELVYRFQVGIDQVTLSDNNSRPALAPSAGVDNYYLGYIKDTGGMHVRFTNPLSPEIQLITATVVDVGYDPVLNKVVVLFVNNGNVYVTTANPGDGPNSIIPPGEAQTPTKAVAFPYDSLSIGAAGAGTRRNPYVGFPRTLTPVVISLNPRVIRFNRPTDVAENGLCVGFLPFKSSQDYSGGRVLPFVALPDGAVYADYTDPAPTPRATYSAICVYRQGQSTGLVYSEVGGEDRLPTGADVLTMQPAGSGSQSRFGSQSFPPLKLAVPLDGLTLGGPSGAGLRQAFGSVTFAPVKLATSVDPLSMGGPAGAGIRAAFGR